MWFFSYSSLLVFILSSIVFAQKKGKDYGWPVISYGLNYSGLKFTEITEKEEMEQPLHYWIPNYCAKWNGSCESWYLSKLERKFIIRSSEVSIHF